MFYKNLRVFLVLLATGGCVFSSDVSFQEISYASRTFTGNAVTLPLSSGATASSQPLSLFFSNNAAPQLTYGGLSQSTSFNSGNVYTSKNNQYQMAFLDRPQGGPATMDVVYTLIHDQVNNTGSIYVDGTQTPGAALAGLPTATFTGSTNFMDTNANWSIGSASVNVNFGTGVVGGSFTGYPTNSAATLNLAPTPLAGSTFTTTLTSPTLTISSSQVEGALYGPTANSLAGTILLSTPTDASIGLFGANR